MGKKTYTVTLIGCGKMGSAMLHSWIDNNLISKITIIDPSNIPDIFLNSPLVNHLKNTENYYIDTDILVIAVKPQSFEEATMELKNSISEKTVIISIAAGKSIKSIENIFGSKMPIVRAMPNTPASIGKGANAAIANNNISTEQKKYVSDLIRALGTLQWLDNEYLMNAVTALSGSGPAYVFYIIETLAKSGEKLGLDRDLAMSLARQTVIGSAALAEHEKNTKIYQLRENVTSPNGTTEAALNILMDGRLQDIFDETLLHAQKRGIELNK